jgi:ankyrin repeat protein
LLLDRGLDIHNGFNADSSKVKDALLEAAKLGRNAVVRLLLEKGAELKTKDSYGQTPLSWSARNRHEAVVKLLLEKGAKLKTKDS